MSVSFPDSAYPELARPEFARDLRIHYKHHPYELHGKGHVQALPFWEHAEVLQFGGIAHYSEDAGLRLLVMKTPPGGEFADEFVVCLLDLGHESMGLPIEVAVYEALYRQPGDLTPRLAVRPWSGDDGFMTPIKRGDRAIERFMKPWPEAGSFNHMPDVDDPTTCWQCGQPVDTPV